MHTTLCNKQVCPEFINIKIENNILHRSGAKSTLRNVALKDFPLSLQIYV